MTDYTAYLSKPFLRGKIIEAQYTEQPIIDYRGNPYIEALPPILSPQETKHALTFHPFFDIEERKLPPHIRLHCVERIKDLIEPLSDHIDMEQRFSRMIRHGYTSIYRNPMTPEYVRMLNAGANAIENRELSYYAKYAQERSTASGFVIIGMSGVGKTTAVEKILLQYPQVIIHKKYKDIRLFSKQLVWLKLDCPFDGGVKGLCLKFFHIIDQLLDSHYYSNYAKGTTEIMLPQMAQTAFRQGLGVLVIDEIQNINQAKSGGSQKMLNFFVELVNTIGIPVVLIGTKQALEPISTAFCNARRGTGEGDKHWIPLQNDNEWAKLVNTLFKYQWTENESPLTKELSDLLYEESCGITDIAIKLYMLAQWRAITTGREKISASIIKSVAKDSLKLVKPALDLIKQGESEKLFAQYPDVLISQSQMNEFRRIYLLKLDKIKAPIMDSPKDSSKTEDIESKISAWLLNAGFDLDSSLDTAKKVVDRLGSHTQLTLLYKEAFKIISNVLSIDEKHKDVENPSINKELVPLLDKSKEVNKCISAILTEKNIIKSPSEFI